MFQLQYMNSTFYNSTNQNNTNIETFQNNPFINEIQSPKSDQDTSEKRAVLTEGRNRNLSRLC